MSDEFFLLYANRLFKDDPNNLSLITQDFNKQQLGINKATGIYNEFDEVRLELITETIIILSECSDYDSALSIRDKLKLKMELEAKENRRLYKPDFDPNHADVAFEAVFYYRNGFCGEAMMLDANGSCTGFRSDQYDFGLGDNYKAKCHECYQLCFRSMLLDFVSNDGFHRRTVYKEGDSIGLIDETWLDENLPEANSIEFPNTHYRKSFDWYLYKAYDCVEIRADRNNNSIVKYEFFSMKNLFNDKLSIYPVSTRFNDYLISVVSYSLVEFLRKNDHRKIKLCPFCNSFFIAEDIRRERCYSKKCERAYQRERKRKQRDSDPVKYY